MTGAPLPLCLHHPQFSGRTIQSGYVDLARGYNLLFAAGVMINLIPIQWLYEGLAMRTEDLLIHLGKVNCLKRIEGEQLNC